jgi:integrase
MIFRGGSHGTQGQGYVARHPHRQAEAEATQKAVLAQGPHRARHRLPSVCRRTGRTWTARRYIGDERYQERGVGLADDYSDADGIAVRIFDQAVDAARAWDAECAKGDAGQPAKPFTVDDAIDLKCAALERAGRDAAARDVRGKYDAWARERLGRKEAGKIITKQFEDFLDAIAKSPPKLRTAPGKKQQFRLADSSDEGVRKRRATAVRLWGNLKAVLNMAWRAGKIPSDAAWKRVKTFEGVDGVRLDYLQLAEVTRLLNACEPDFRCLVQGGVLTGARYGSLAELVISNFNADAGSVAFKSRKGRGVVKVYHCHLTAEGVAFFKNVCVGRAGNERIFLKSDGSPWGVSEQIRRMSEAVKNAKIGRTITFHHLRHTWASHAVMNGTPLLVVAQNLGHADTRMVEKVYGHLAPSYRKQEIERGAPRFGIEVDPKIAALAS